MARLIAGILPIVLLTIAAPVMAEPILNLETGLSGDDNLNNGLAEAEKKGDVEEYLNVAIGQAISVGADGSAALTANIEAHHFNQYDGMNNVAPGLTLSYKTKLGLGPAPWVRVSGSASHLDYHDDVRSGWLYHGDVGIDKQLSRQWYLTLTSRFEKREADHTEPYGWGIAGDVFDQIGRSFGGTVNYWHDNLTVFSWGYVWRSGDVAASVKKNYALVHKVSAITDDEVFGDEFYAYKLHAQTQLLNFSIGREINRQGMLNFKLQRRIAHGDHDLNYYNSMASINYQHHFY